MSTASRVLIGVGMAIVVGIAYYRYNLLTEDLPSDQLALARLGLDKHPGIGFLSNEKVRD
jgi:hypothetical protein